MKTTLRELFLFISILCVGFTLERYLRNDVELADGFRFGMGVWRLLLSMPIDTAGIMGVIDGDHFTVGMILGVSFFVACCLTAIWLTVLALWRLR